jgi:hypothetical protein
MVILWKLLHSFELMLHRCTRYDARNKLFCWTKTLAMMSIFVEYSNAIVIDEVLHRESDLERASRETLASYLASLAIPVMNQVKVPSRVKNQVNVPVDSRSTSGDKTASCLLDWAIVERRRHGKGISKKKAVNQSVSFLSEKKGSGKDSNEDWND